MTDNSDFPDPDGFCREAVGDYCNLRDRIAAVLWAKDSGYEYIDTDHLVRSWNNIDGVHRTDYYELADAVIAELGLRRETVGLIHRYVTKWDDGGAE